MDYVYHAKEEEGVFFGDFAFLSEGTFAGCYEAKCSQACVNTVLQSEKYRDGLAVTMNESVLEETVASLNVSSHFGISRFQQAEDILLVNWKAGQLQVFGSLVALFQVLKAEGLSLLPMSAELHPQVSSASSDPQSAKGYLYFLEDHWMVLRQLKNRWYKLDPWLGGPQLLNHFYVSLYIKQLMADEKLVFVIQGEFPRCKADDAEDPDLIPPEEEAGCSSDPPQPELNPVLCNPGKPSVQLSMDEINQGLMMMDMLGEGEDKEFALACLLSLEDDFRQLKHQEDLKKTLAESMVQVPESQSVGSNGVLAKRKNGTAVSPLSTSETLNSSFMSDDLGISFEVMYGAEGDGVVCLDAPSPGRGSTPSPPLTRPNPSAIPSKVFIMSSDISTFRKVISHEVKGAEAEEASHAEEEMCCVCWAALPSHVVVPCGHFCLCANCVLCILQPPPAETLCPLCKQKSDSIIKLFK